MFKKIIIALLTLAFVFTLITCKTDTTDPWQEYLDRIESCIVFLPVGATEQHGPHLPLGTDSYQLAIYRVLIQAINDCNTWFLAILTLGI